MTEKVNGHHSCPKCLGSKELVKINDNAEETMEKCYYCNGEGWIFYEDSPELVDDFTDYEDDLLDDMITPEEDFDEYFD